MSHNPYLLLPNNCFVTLVLIWTWGKLFLHWRLWSKMHAASPEWPALHLSLLVPIKLTPRSIMQWPILKSFTMLRRQNKDAFRSVEEKCWTLSNGQPGAPSLGGREVTAVTIIYEQLRYNQPLTCNFITNDPTVGWQTITSSADQHRWNSTKGLRTKQTITNQEEHFICDSWNKQ